MSTDNVQNKKSSKSKRLPKKDRPQYDSREIPIERGALQTMYQNNIHTIRLLGIMYEYIEIQQGQIIDLLNRDMEQQVARLPSGSSISLPQLTTPSAPCMQNPSSSKKSDKATAVLEDNNMSKDSTKTPDSDKQTSMLARIADFRAYLPFQKSAPKQSTDDSTQTKIHRIQYKPREGGKAEVRIRRSRITPNIQRIKLNPAISSSYPPSGCKPQFSRLVKETVLPTRQKVIAPIRSKIIKNVSQTSIIPAQKGEPPKCPENPFN